MLSKTTRLLTLSVPTDGFWRLSWWRSQANLHLCRAFGSAYITIASGLSGLSDKLFNINQCTSKEQIYHPESICMVVGCPGCSEVTVRCFCFCLHGWRVLWRIGRSQSLVCCVRCRCLPVCTGRELFVSVYIQRKCLLQLYQKCDRSNDFVRPVRVQKQFQLEFLAVLQPCRYITKSII